MLALACTLTGCGGWQSVLDTHGKSAADVRQLIVLIVVVCALVWTLVMVALIAALWRRRRARPRQSTLDQRTEHRMARAVAIATVATAIVIAGFTAASFFTTRALDVAGGDDLTIRVHGSQWWWNVEYLDPQPGRSFQTANEIHIPVDRNVRLLLEGDDVIHSFWVPSLAGKQDLIPGRPNEITIRADRLGTYRGQCAEFCGMQHAHMAFVVIAETQAAFDQWSEAQRQPATAASDEEVAAGRNIFLAKPCAACHTIRGTQAAGTTGPDLTHVGGRRYIAAGLFETTRGSLAAWIADPQTQKPGNNMPMVPLSPDELRSVSAYMASLR
ncbi:MAG TPA: cytochrome c oxidase subunit II [Bradyrhizobium sp.]|uniref:cytochrome c oxidase subunit II n=1 Tax=Bradyrhizobium sp. TaxID=376 RepID=UPI002D7E44D7|nr:cytochrome c oxidase subunit II [Bradyrhizobium sp.]HET7884990.1 cytochrome c oxidase subunit II [Bradyrhizobium sp.]